MKRAVGTFFPGNDPLIQEGDLYADDHPYVAMYPANFADVVVHEAPSRKRTVEQATAAPGEQRQVKR